MLLKNRKEVASFSLHFWAYILLMCLLIFSVIVWAFEAEATVFESDVRVRAYNDSLRVTVDNVDTTDTVTWNVDMADGVNIDSLLKAKIRRDCQTQTGSYDNDDMANLSKLFESSLSVMKSNLQGCVDAWSDSKSYFAPYVSCVSNLSSCSEQKTRLNKDAEMMSSYKTQFETCTPQLQSVSAEASACLSERKSCQDRMDVCSAELQKEKDSKPILGIHLLSFLVGGGLAGVAIWQIKSKTARSQTARI